MTAETRAILAIIDPGVEAQPGLERAAWLATTLRLPLELLICAYDSHLAGERFQDAPTLEDARQELLRAHLQRLGELRDRIARPGLEINLDARWSPALDRGITQKAIESRPALVVKDTHFHARPKRAVFSNTDWNLIRECPAPLWLVKPRPFGSPPTVLAAVDPLHARDESALLDHAILTIAQEISAASSATLHVGHAFRAMAEVVAETDTIATPISIPIADTVGEAEARHRDALERLLRFYEIPPKRVHLLDGMPHEVLIALAARLKADLVVMGAVRRGALERALVGSTAERALDRLPCDLLIIKLT